MADRVFADWAERLKQRGIRTIAGRIVGDDNAFEDETLGFGWSWDDLPDDYAAGVGALQFNENAVRVTVAPGSGGRRFRRPSAVAPGGSGLTIVNAVVDRRAGQRRVDQHAPAAGQHDGWSCAARSRSARAPSTLAVVGRQPDAVLRRRAAQRADRQRHRRARCRQWTSTTCATRRRRPARTAAVVSVAAALDARGAADEGQPEPVRGDVVEDVSERRPATPTAAAGRTAAQAILQALGRAGGRADPARRLGAVALRFRHAGSAGHDPRARRSGRPAARTVRGVAADRRPRRHAGEPDERERRRKATRARRPDR